MMGMASAGSAESGLQALLELVTDPQAVKDRVAALQAEQAKLADVSTQAAASKASADKAQADAAVAIKDAAVAMAALDKKASDFQASVDAVDAQQNKTQQAIDEQNSALVQRENTVAGREKAQSNAAKSLNDAIAAFQADQAKAQSNIAALTAQAQDDAAAAAALKADYEQRLAKLKILVA